MAYVVLIGVLRNTSMSRAFVLLNCDIGSENDTMMEVKGISGVSRASKVSGVYDIVADLKANSDADIARIVNAFGLIKGIRSSLTMIVSEKNDLRGEPIQ